MEETAQEIARENELLLEQSIRWHTERDARGEGIKPEDRSEVNTAFVKAHERECIVVRLCDDNCVPLAFGGESHGDGHVKVFLGETLRSNRGNGLCGQNVYVPVAAINSLAMFCAIEQNVELGKVMVRLEGGGVVSLLGSTEQLMLAEAYLYGWIGCQNRFLLERGRRMQAAVGD